VTRGSLEKRRVRRRSRGFTLVEVLVALALASLVLVVLFTGVRLGFTGLQRIEARAESLETRRNVTFVLRRQLAAAYPGVLGEVTTPSFVGAPSVASFLALESNAGPGFYRIWIALEDDRAGRRLVLLRQSGGGIERAVLARNVREFRLAYFGAPTATDERAWRDRWERSRRAPEAVSVGLALDSDGDRAWPEDVVRIWSGSDGP
jgi:general secretion pathway protein J